MGGTESHNGTHTNTTTRESIKTTIRDGRFSSLETYGSAESMKHLTSTPAWAQLKSYQKSAVHWLDVLYSNGASGIFSDEAGMGKPSSVIAFLASHKASSKGPVAILAPAEELADWADELSRLAPQLKVAHTVSGVVTADVLLVTFPDGDAKVSSSIVAALSKCGIDMAFIVAPDHELGHTSVIQHRTLFAKLSCPRYYVLPALPLPLRSQIAPVLLAPQVVPEDKLAASLAAFSMTDVFDRITESISPLILQRTAAEVLQSALPQSAINRAGSLVRANQGSLSRAGSLVQLDQQGGEQPFRVSLVGPASLNSKADLAAVAIGARKSSLVAVKEETADVEFEDEESLASLAKYKAGSMRRLFSEAGPFKRLYVVGVTALVLASISQIFVNVLLGMLVDELNDDDVDIWSVLQIFLYNAAVMAVLNFTWMYLLWNTGDKIVASMRKRLFWAIINREIGFFDKERTGALMSRLAGDVSLVKVALTIELTDFIQRGVTIVASLGYMFYVSWSLTLIAAAIAPVLGFIGSNLARYFHRIARESNDLLAEANVHAEEAFSSAKTVRSFAQEGSIYRMYATLADRTLAIQMKSNLAKSFQRTTVYLLAMCAVTLALWYGSKQVEDGKVSSGKLMSFLLLGVQVGEKCGQCLDNFSQLKAAAGASCKVFMYLDAGLHHLHTNIKAQDKILPAEAFEAMEPLDGEQPPQISSEISIVVGKTTNSKIRFNQEKERNAEMSIEHDVTLDGVVINLDPKTILLRNERRKMNLAHRRRAKYPIVFEDVWFRYPLRPDRDVLRGLNLTLQPGTVVALVGPSGGGKSTIIGLLERFYLPYKGTVKWGGVNMNEFDAKWLHRQIGYVGQEPTLLGGTVRDNILFGIRGVESFDDLPVEEQNFWQAKVEAAAKAANAHDFIMSWPDKYLTRVGERGAQVSGGQKQRIAIARAMIIDPPILLLDEATSALDSESEMHVQAALESLMVGRTTMMIAHRLSTVRNADVVVCLSGGKVAEMGSHDELMALGGIYAHLVTPQLEKEEAEAHTVFH